MLANNLAFIQDKPPLVSVLVALYNADDLIDKLMTSILETEYENLEILLVDDSSTDNTFKSCKDWEKRDSRIKCFQNEKNEGIFPTYARLLGNAKGKYVIWNDQDDFRDPTFIRKAVKILESNPKVVLCHSLTMVSVESLNVHITTIDAISGQLSLVRRYWRLIRNFSDITIYGLIVREALERTTKWQPVIGSCNLLLFELMLVGEFSQIDEMLFYYTGKGFSKRPDTKAERDRSIVEKQASKVAPPWFVLTILQIRSIWKINGPNLFEKILLTFAIGLHFFASSLAKILYRFISKLFGQRAGRNFRKILGFFVISEKNTIQIVQKDDYPEIYSLDYPLK